MNLKYLDLFSTQFQFNVGQRQVSKRSAIGTLLSILVICLSIVYFIYLLLLYLGNQIDPKYKSQTFITDDSIQVDYHNEYVGFRYEYETNKPIEELEQITGKKYLVYIPYFEVQSPSGRERIFLDVIPCQGDILLGYNCIDFSKAKPEVLESYNAKNIYKFLFVLVYRCTDIDLYKKTIPSNCAADSEIVKMMSGSFTRFRLKMLTSQYNTVTEQIQSSYKNTILFVNKDDYLNVKFKTVKQTTLIKKGPFIQKETKFSSPIDYTFDQRVFNRQSTQQSLNLSMHINMQIGVSEYFQQIQIQYATFMEILTICNSTFAVLMGVGVIGKYFAKQLIKEDISLLLLQNIYLSHYLKSLQKNNIYQNRISEQETIINTEKKEDDVIENIQQVFIPSFFTNSNSTIGMNKINSQEQSPLDFVLENSKLELHQYNPIDKECTENTILGTEGSERVKFNITIGNRNSTIVGLDHQQPINKESNHQFLQKKSLSKIQSLQQNQKEFSDFTNSKINSKQIKFSKQASKSNSNLIQQKESLSQSIQSKQQNNYDKDQNHKQIFKSKCFENLKAIQNVSFGNKIKDLLFKPKQSYYYYFLNIQQILLISRCCKKQKSKINESLDPIFKKALDEEVQRNLDILQLYKDIITLKKAIMMVLSKDQYAAIQLIGISGVHYSSQNNNQDDRNIEVKVKIQILKLITLQKEQDSCMKFGYLDEQFMISQSLEKQADYINVFLDRWKNDQDLNEIDKRIYSSLNYS